MYGCCCDAGVDAGVVACVAVGVDVDVVDFFYPQTHQPSRPPTLNTKRNNNQTIHRIKPGQTKPNNVPCHL